MNIIDLVLNNNPPWELARFAALMRWGSEHGVTLITDTRTSGITMTPCNEFLCEALENAGMRVSYVDSVMRLPKNTLCILYANIWSKEMHKNKTDNYARFMGAKRAGPLIVCQTEHQGVRLGADKSYISLLKHADQVWDYGFSPFPKTKSFFFPHMLWATKYMMNDVTKPETKPSVKPIKELVAMAGSLDKGRELLFVKLKAVGLKTALLKNLTPENTINYFKEHVRIAPMLPRQRGNFELHRFGCLICTDVLIVATKCRDVPIMRWLSQVVAFTGSLDAMVPLIAHIPSDIKERLVKQKEWWASQDHSTLIIRLLFKLSTVPTIKSFKCFEEEEYHKLSATFNPITKKNKKKIEINTEKEKEVKLIPEKLISDKLILDKQIPNNLIQDKLVSDKPILNKLVSDKPILDKLISDKPILDKLVSDKPIPEKLISDNLIPDKLISDKPIPEKLISDNLISDKLISDKQVPEKLISDKLISDKLISDNLISDKLISDKQFPEKLISDKLISDKLISDKLIPDKLISDNLIPDKLISDKLISDKLISDKLISDKLIPDKLILDKLVVDLSEKLNGVEEKPNTLKIKKKIDIIDTVKATLFSGKGIMNNISLIERNKHKKQIKNKKYRY